jgi:hypothetical protein
MHEIARLYFWFTGANDESGRAYGIWSGFGGSVPDFLLLGGAVTYYRTHVCHNATCHKIGRHTTPQGYRLCKRCVAKPADQLELHAIHEDHR